MLCTPCRALCLALPLATAMLALANPPPIDALEPPEAAMLPTAELTRAETEYSDAGNWNDEVTFFNREPKTFWTWGPNGVYEADIDIDRYYGTAAEVEKQRAHALLPEFAQLIIPAFDCDSGNDMSGTKYFPEFDAVYLNGTYLGLLQGADKAWSFTRFNIPWEALKLPARPGETAHNHLRIVVDIKNSERVWVLGQLWQEIYLPAPRPILLVHGWTDAADALSELQQVIRDQLGIPSERAHVEMELAPEDNASLLQQQLQDFTTAYHVRQFNLLVHSKGGLDGRVLIDAGAPRGQASKYVKNLLQISTPNGGSHLADLLIHPETWGDQAIRKIGNTVVWKYTHDSPALRSLTTDACARFNRLYCRPDAPIHTVTGSVPTFPVMAFHPGLSYDYCWGYGYIGWLGYDHNFDDAVPEHKGDGIVQVVSAHAIGTQVAGSPLLLPGRNGDHHHITVEGAPAVLALFHDSLAEIVTGATGGIIPSGAFNPLLDPYSSQNRSAEPADEDADADAEAEDNPANGWGATEPLLDLAIPAGALAQATVSIFTPGTVSALLAGLPAAMTAEWAAPDGRKVEFTALAEDGEDPEPFLAQFSQAILEDGPAGTYTLTVDGTAAAEDALVALAVHAEEQPLRLIAWQEEQDTPSATLEFHAYAQFYDTLCLGPGLNFTLECQNLASDDAPIVELTMHDDGDDGDAVANDGVFSLRFTPPTEGLQKIQIVLEGAFDGQPAQRRWSFYAAALSDTVTLDRNFSETTPDDDGDGLLDALCCTFAATVSTPGKYRLRASLTADDGALIADAAAQADAATAGETLHFLLKFPGEKIFEARKDGPYLITSLVLERLLDSPETAVTLTPPLEPLATAGHSYLSFAHAPFLLTGNGADHADGQAMEYTGSHVQQLCASLDLVVAPGGGGSYRASATLAGPDGKLLAHSDPLDVTLAPTTDLTQPSHLPFTFPGKDLRESGVDGPYVIFHVILTREITAKTTQLFPVDGSYETKAYLASQFALNTLYLSFSASSGVALTLPEAPDADGIYTATLTFTPTDAILQANNCPNATLTGNFAVCLNPMITNAFQLIETVENSSHMFVYSYQDHTEEALAQLRAQGNHDEVFDVGETLTFQVRYTAGETATGAPPFLLVISALSPLGRSLRKSSRICHPFDADCNGVLSAAELAAGYRQWQLGNVTHRFFLTAIGLAGDRGYQYEPASATFVAR